MQSQPQTKYVANRPDPRSSHRGANGKQDESETLHGILWADVKEGVIQKLGPKCWLCRLVRLLSIIPNPRDLSDDSIVFENNGTTQPCPVGPLTFSILGVIPLLLGLPGDSTKWRAQEV